MNDDPVYNHFHELIWRRNPSEAEAAELQSYLKAHPEAAEELETETQLNLLLEQLPEAPPVASNFTARVLQVVEREGTVQSQNQPPWWISFRRWLPRTAMACLTVALGLLTYEHHQMKTRAEMARSVAEISAIVSASNPELLKDFEPIRRLSDPEPKADAELLALY